MNNRRFSSIIFLLFLFTLSASRANAYYNYQNYQGIDSLKYHGKSRIIKIGTSFNAINTAAGNYLIDVEYEKGLKRLKRLSWAFHYQRRRKIFGTIFHNPGMPPISFLSRGHDNVLMLNGRFYPFLFKREIMSLMYLQGGVSYWIRRVKDVTPYHGPGYTLGGGIQMRVYKNICVEIYYFIGYYSNFSSSSIDRKFYYSGGYYGIKLGYKF